MNMQNICICFINWLQFQFKKLQRIYRKHYSDPERSNIPDDEIVKYINKLIPELSYSGSPPPIAWECKVESLPNPRFKVNTMVVWNDACIHSMHGARKHFGEGPFRVVLIEDYIIELTIRTDSHTTVHIPDGQKIALEGGGKTIIAHPGYFIHYEGG